MLIYTNFFSFSGERIFDVRIFYLLYVISSILIYNTTSLIIEKGINEFTILSEMINQLDIVK